MANYGVHRTPDVSGAVLAQAYARTDGGFVAFLDESFELDQTRKTFYIMSAVVTHRDELAALRDGLHKTVGGNYWHTTERLRTESGRRQTIEVAKYLGAEDGTEVCVISCQTEIGPDGGDAARASCFTHVASLLCSGAGPLEGGVHLMVLEQRETNRERSFDAQIIKRLRDDGGICRRCRLVQASPRAEKLLWLPDLVSSAYRQSLTRDDRAYLDPIAHIVTVFKRPNIQSNPGAP